ncbi:MAG: hypothetical protein EU550_00505 [Promethearchaeota archaeon]|nr:MAG: hypothetical protein EU550_00505 [Candidatus Lokiarchaeota archaeon]
MNITPMFFVAAFPSFLLIAGAIITLLTKNDKDRGNFHLIVSFLCLIITLVLMFFTILNPRRELFYNILFSASQYVLIVLIFTFQFVFSVFIKYTSNNYPYAYIFDVFTFLIYFSFIGIIVSINLITLVSFFIFALILIGMNFYFGEFYKEFRLLKKYFFASCICALLLISATIIFVIDTGTTNIYHLEGTTMSDVANSLVSILLILGFGVPCGLFPFYVFHLKRYFQESNYFHLITYIAFNFVSTLTIIRLSNSIFTLFPGISLVLLIFSGLGITITLYYIILELFTSHDGFTYSIKKILGYSVIGDSNLIFFLFMNFHLFPAPHMNNLLNLLIFLIGALILVKLIFVISFLQAANNSNEDNFRLLGNFWKNEKIFGFFLLFSGLILIFPICFLFIYSFLENYEFVYTFLNSLTSMISIISIIMLLLSFSIALLYISHIFVQTYISKNTSYLERENPHIINKKIVYFLGILVFGMLIAMVIIYFSVPGWYLGLITAYY